MSMYIVTVNPKINHKTDIIKEYTIFSPWAKMEFGTIRGQVTYLVFSESYMSLEHESA